MVKLSFLHICDMAFFTADTQSLNIIGMFTSINATAFPAFHPRLCIVVGLETETPGEYNLELSFADEIAQILKVTHKPMVGKDGGRWIHSAVNLQIPREGEYSISVKYNGEVLGSTKLFAKKV